MMHATESNPGLAAARKAAQAVGGAIAIPEFRNDRPAGATDFNDLAALSGLESVKRIFDKAASQFGSVVSVSSEAFTENDHIGPLPELPQKDIPQVEPVPTQALPDCLKAWVSDVSERLQVPQDFIINALIVLLSSVIGTGCTIRPKQFDDWTVFVNLWGGFCALPSSKKSAAINAVLKLLEFLEKKEHEEHETALESYKTEVMAYEIEVDVAKKNFKQEMGKKYQKDKGLYEEQAKVALENLIAEEPEAPVQRRFRTSDTTIEKICDLLSTNERGLLVSSDELIGLLHSMDKQGQEQARAIYLQSWNGGDSYVVDRIGRGTIFIPRLCISIFGGIQPAKLIEYFKNSFTSQNDGLFQRLQLLVDPDPIKEIKWVDRKPDIEAEKRVTSLVEKLAYTNFIEFGATQEEEKSIPYFRFSPEAQLRFKDWSIELEQKIRDDESLIFQEHLAKYRSLIPSLALIFHLCNLVTQSSSGPITLKALESAITYSLYLESHARRIYALAIDTQFEGAIELARKIKAGKLKNGFSTRQVYRKGWHQLKDQDSAQNACTELAELGWLSSSKTETGKLIFNINPRISEIEI